MPRYRVEALEKFLVRTIYYVDAVNEQEAVRQCKAGDVPYEKHEIVEGDDEWIDTLSVHQGNK
jgi:hypothetical protein